MKSSGKRSRLRFTCRLSCPTSTPYSSARSRSSMTCMPRTVRIRERMASAPVGSGRHATTSLGADAGSPMFFLAISFLFCLVAIRAPVPPRTPLRAHHARRLAHSKANPQENQCKIFVKACKNLLHRFYTVFTRGDCPHRKTPQRNTGTVPMSMLTRRQNEQLTSRGGPRGGFSRRS